jgi:hypothetical protein
MRGVFKESADAPGRSKSGGRCTSRHWLRPHAGASRRYLASHRVARRGVAAGDRGPMSNDISGTQGPTRPRGGGSSPWPAATTQGAVVDARWRRRPHQCFRYYSMRRHTQRLLYFGALLHRSRFPPFPRHRRWNEPSPPWPEAAQPPSLRSGHWPKLSRERALGVLFHRVRPDPGTERDPRA